MDIRYDEKMEELFEQAYERIMAKKGGTAKQRKRVKKSYEEESQLLEVWNFLFLQLNCLYESLAI